MNTTIDREALAALLIEHPEELCAQVRMTGLSEAALIHMIANRLDELAFCQWSSDRHVGGLQAPNPDMRTWTSRRQLTEAANELHRRSGSGHTALAELLFEIPGVIDVYVHPYELTITKSSAFGWNEIAPRVSGIIAGFNVQ